MKKVVQYASGDFKKASLLGTVRWPRRVFIVFDYDNPEHLDTCRVLGFKFRPSIKPFYAPAAPVHSTVNSWARENERCHLSFPRQSQVCYRTMHLNLITDLSSKITSSPKQNLPCPPLSGAITTDAATFEESITSDLATAKEGIAKYPHSDNESNVTIVLRVESREVGRNPRTYLSIQERAPHQIGLSRGWVSKHPAHTI
jgi:hypothetical protein